MNKLVSCFLFLCYSLCARAQGNFTNLFFGMCQIPQSAPEGYYPSTQAIPFWTVSVGSNQVNSLYYNNITNGAPSVVLLNTNTSYPWYYGERITNHYALMMTSGYLGQSYSGEATFLPVSIAQTGKFPSSAKTLLFLATAQFDYWQVTVNGVQLRTYEKATMNGSSPENVYWYEADISQFAGKTGELKFTAIVPPLQPDAAAVELGEIQFSAVAIPAVPTTPPPTPWLQISRSGPTGPIPTFSSSTTKEAYYTLYRTSGPQLGLPLSSWSVFASSIKGNGWGVMFNDDSSGPTFFYRIEARWLP